MSPSVLPLGFTVLTAQSSFPGDLALENKIPLFLFLTGTQSLAVLGSSHCLELKILQLQLAEFWDYRHIELSPTSYSDSF